MAWVTPINKKERKHLCSNYTLITDAFSLFYEKILKNITEEEYSPYETEK